MDLQRASCTLDPCIDIYVPHTSCKYTLENRFSRTHLWYRYCYQFQVVVKAVLPLLLMLVDMNPRQSVTLLFLLLHLLH